MTERPVGSRALARAAASNAVSVPIEPIREATRMARIIGGRRIGWMTRYYAIDEANAALHDVEPILAALRDQRAELIELRDEAVPATPDPRATTTGEAAEALRLLRLRLQGLIDHTHAGVVRLVGLDITLRDISTGLIDLPP